MKTLSFIDDVGKEMQRIEDEKNRAVDFTDEEKANYDAIRASVFGSSAGVDDSFANE